MSFLQIYGLALLVTLGLMTLLEKTLETRPGYSEYIQRTSSFIPWFPRRTRK